MRLFFLTTWWHSLVDIFPVSTHCRSVLVTIAMCMVDFIARTIKLGRFMSQTISFNHANFPVSVHTYSVCKITIARSPLGSIFFIFMQFLENPVSAPDMIGTRGYFSHLISTLNNTLTGEHILKYYLLCLHLVW